MRAKVLTVAGSDPSGGAGIQADLSVFAAWGCHGAAVVTALTAQDTTAVHEIHAPPARFVGRCLDAVLDDVRPAATKTGMLHDADTVEVVAERLAGRRGGPVVVDPVGVSTSGTPLRQEGALDALVRRLLPLAALVTPNRREAEALAGRAVRDVRDAEEAARRIAGLGPGAVLVKGGHLAGPRAVDVLFHGSRIVRFERERLADVRLHGAGCTLSAAIAAALARGADLETAVGAAGDWTHRAIRAAAPVGRGGMPLDHRVPLPEPFR